MNRKFAGVTGLFLATVLATTAIGEGEVDKALAAAVHARQSHMSLYAYNIGLLGGMAKTEIEYDAEAASAAAANLAALSKLDQSRYWLEGTDNEALGDMTEALPKIWAEDSDISAKIQALADAAETMNGAAGESLEALQGAMAGLGGACGGCHKVYRQASN